MGRKSKYESHVQPRLGEIAEWYQTMTEGEIADRLGVSQVSFEAYKKSHEELRDCLRDARKAFCAELKASLKKKAVGYEYIETKTCIRREGNKDIKVIEEYKKYAHPDTGAIHLLLKNLDPDWRNDDEATLSLKRAKLELEKMKAEAEIW